MAEHRRREAGRDAPFAGIRNSAPSSAFVYAILKLPFFAVLYHIQLTGTAAVWHFPHRNRRGNAALFFHAFISLFPSNSLIVASPSCEMSFPTMTCVNVIQRIRRSNPNDLRSTYSTS